jgi:O-antigen/teichoic acid export membrane protein
MSMFRRLAAGQIATVASLVAGLLAQVVTVPIFLSRWSTTMFGAWLGVQSLVSIMSCWDYGLQDYMAFRTLQLGPTRTKSISRLLGACMQVGAVFGLLEFLLALILVLTGSHTILFGLAKTETKELIVGSAVAYLAATATSSITMSVASYFNRAAPALGMYTRLTWWAVAVTTVSAAAPSIAAWYGASMALAAIVQFVAVMAVWSIQTFDFFVRFSRLGIRPRVPHRIFPMLIFRRARLGYAKNILEQARQQGVTVLLAPLTGATSVAAFRTTRTIANVGTQVGLTMSNPIIPELGSLIRERKSIHVAGAFALIWALMAVLIIPGVLTIQVIGEGLFHWWTHGKLAFEPKLLATLLCGVSWSFATFPSITLVRSQNDFVCLSRVMLISSIVLLLAVVGLVPKMGILGAGIAVLAGEVTAYGLITYEARLWAGRLNLLWPTNSTRWSQLSLIVGAASLGLIVYHPAGKWITLPVSILIQLLLALLLFYEVPHSLRSRILKRRHR